MIEKGVSHIAYFRLDGGSSKLYTQEYVDGKDKEIERLKKGYCELKEKCNKGECDCTHEEYNSMCEQNIKLMNRIDKAIEHIEKVKDMYTINEVVNQVGIPILDISIEIWKKELLDILKGSDKE